MARTALPDRLVAGFGATSAVALIIAACAKLPHASADLPIIFAPLGGSAVLVFAFPASPLAQPWPVLGGNTVSTLVGVAAFKLIPELGVAASVAVGGAILVMSLLRCLHPPGGAAALTAVVGSRSIHAAGYGLAFAPVSVAAGTLVVIALIFHRVMGRAYPHLPPCR